MKANNLMTASLSNVAQTAEVKAQNAVRKVDKLSNTSAEGKDSFDDALQTAKQAEPQATKANEVKEVEPLKEEAVGQENPQTEPAEAGKAAGQQDQLPEVEPEEPEVKPQAIALDAMLLALAGSNQLQVNDTPLQVTEENTSQLTAVVADTLPEEQNLMTKLTSLESLLPSEANALNKETSLQSLVPQGGQTEQQSQQGQQLMQLLAGNNALNHVQLTETAQNTVVEQGTQNIEQLVRNTEQTVLEAPQQATQVIAANLETLQELQKPAEPVKEGAEQQDVQSLLGETILTVEKQSEPLQQVQSVKAQLQQQNQQAPEQNTSGEIISQKLQTPGEAAFDSVNVVRNTDEAVAPQLAGASLQQPFMPQMVDNAANVAEAPVEQPQVDNNNVMQQIVQQARLIQAEDGNEMVIKLEPEYLGELTMRIAVKGDGTVNATFLAETAQTRSILQSSLVELKQQLEAQGMKVDNVEVSSQLNQDFFAHSEAGQQGYQFQQQSDSARNEAALRTAFVENAEATTEFVDTAVPTGTEVNHATDDGVDYRV